MSRLVIDWPDEGAERVRAVRGRLMLAGQTLRSIPFEERLTAVARVLDDWTRVDSPWRRELAASLADVTPFSAGTIREGLDSALRAWDPASFVRCAHQELGGALEGGTRRLAPFEWTCVLAGGSIPMPTLLSALLPLVVGSPVLLRETSNDPITAPLLARSLANRDERLARSFASLRFPATDAAAFEVALSAPCVVATGSDETIASIAARLTPRQRFVGYGHRFSIAVVGPGVEHSSDARARIARDIALDVARWDQSGCLSPAVVYFVGLEPASREALAGEISAALGTLAEAMPRGPVPDHARVEIANQRAEARMRVAAGEAMLFEGPEHTVVLENDPRPRPAPLHRFVRVHAVASTDALVEALRPFAGQLSNVALAGFDVADAAQNDRAPAPGSLASGFDASEALSTLGVSRFTTPGRLQTPPVDWPHDGLPLFTPLARFANSMNSRSDCGN